MADTFLHPKGNISAKRGTPLKVRIDFDEMRFKKIDDKETGISYNVWFYAIACDAYAYEDKKTKEKAEVPGKIFLNVQAKDDQPGQRAIVKALEELDETKTYSGFMNVDDTAAIYGKAVDKPAIWEEMKGEVIAAVEVEPSKLSDDDLKPVGGYKKGGFNAPAETAYDASQGRLKAFKEMMTDTDLTDFATLYATDQKVSASQAMLTVIEVILK